MIDSGSLPLAHARVHARLGQRADAAHWQRLEVVREPAALLQAARQTPLRPWLVGLTADSDAGAVEAALRGHWLALVDDTVRWMPPHWHPALKWFALGAELPALQHLARGGQTWPWLLHEPHWRALAESTPAQRAAVLTDGPWAPLAAAWPAPDALGAAWLDEWRRRCGGDEGLGRLTALLQRHLQDMARAPAGSAAPQRRQLAVQLRLLLRRLGPSAAVGFVHLALSALELQRLRGELLTRRLFDSALQEA